MTERFVTRGFVGRRATADARRCDAPRTPPGQYLTTRLPGPLGRPDAADAARSLVVLDRGPRRRARALDVGRVPRPAEPRLGRRHQLRDEVDAARHALARRERRHAARGRRAADPTAAFVDRLLRRRLHDEPAARRRAQQPGVRRVRVRRPAAGAGARRPGAPRRPGALLLEEREVDPRAAHPGRATSPASGSRSATTTAATSGSKSATAAIERDDRWPDPSPGSSRRSPRSATRRRRSARSRSRCPAGRPSPGPARRPAADGRGRLQRRAVLLDRVGAGAERARSTSRVERIDGGEVSPFLHEVVVAGDRLEVRGPIGGYFVWEAALGGPLLLVAGGSGVVPLMAMVRHRARAASDAPARLLFSSRGPDEIIYRDELERLAAPGDGFEVVHTLTRSQPPGWTGYARRIDERDARRGPRAARARRARATRAGRRRSSRPSPTRSSGSACRPTASGPSASARPAPDEEEANTMDRATSGTRWRRPCSTAMPSPGCSPQSSGQT